MEEAIKAIEYLTKVCKGEVSIPRIDFVPVINAKWEKHSCCDFYRCSNCKAYWDSDFYVNSDNIFDLLKEKIDETNPDSDFNGRFAGKVTISVEFFCECAEEGKESGVDKNVL